MKNGSIHINQNRDRENNIHFLVDEEFTGKGRI